MSEKKDRERVIAEITHSHLVRLGNERGCPVSRIWPMNSAVF